MKTDNRRKCPRCWGKYKLDVRPRPVGIKTWMENGKKVTNYKYVCSWERTEADVV